MPVLVDAVRAWAAGARRAVDATTGAGGHTALLRETGAEVLAIDRDPEALAAARERLGEVGITYIGMSFGSTEALATVAAYRPDRILVDLGVAWRQLDDPTRGFTFRPGAPLDMRMTPGRGLSAADVLNTWSEERLTAVFASGADEPRARALARAVVRRRTRTLFRTSDHLVNAIREVRGPRAGPADFARLFQSIRIVVNEEGEELGRALPAFRDALVPGGRLGVITYHSGEDRAVKHAFRDWACACVCPPGQPVCTCRGRPLGTVLTRKALTPGPEEIARNPRARSAKFRSFRKAEVADGD